MPRPLKQLTKDIEKDLIKGRKELAKTIVKTLTEEGPWWTGTFGENWVVSKNPVQPTRKRKPDFPHYLIPDPTGRRIKNARVPNVVLGQDLYVGNRAKYAGFAINAPGQTRPNLKGEPVTYAEHGRDFSLTARKGPNWYNIYTKGNFIKFDINKAFKKVGFK
tara:strand:+ start:34 stop:519 length:486 start_codon:yes stop_codon:yes gene_type:complete